MMAVNEGFTREYEDISEYARYRESLYITDGVILYQDRVVIPSSLRKVILQGLHSAHQGVSAMQSRAQSIVFWPGMTLDIQETRSRCRECNRNAPSQAPTPSEPAVPPLTPFEQIFADFFLSLVDTITWSLGIGCLDGVKYFPHQREAPGQEHVAS